MRIAYGSIPEKITYVVKLNAYNHTSNWEGFGGDIVSLKGVHKVFPAVSEKSIETGIKWAGGPGYAFQFEEENTELTDIQILGLERRSQGGRAYKVLIPNSNFKNFDKDLPLVFDLREDSLTYAMINSSIVKGVIQTPMRWGTIGSQTMLLPTESDIWETLEDRNVLRTLPKISYKELKPFNLYRNKQGKNIVYLGVYPCLTHELAEQRIVSKEDVPQDKRKYIHSEKILVQTYRLKNTSAKIWMTIPPHMKPKSIQETQWYYFSWSNSYPTLSEDLGPFLDFPITEEDVISKMVRGARVDNVINGTVGEACIATLGGRNSSALKCGQLIDSYSAYYGGSDYESIRSR